MSTNVQTFSPKINDQSGKVSHSVLYGLDKQIWIRFLAFLSRLFDWKIFTDSTKFMWWKGHTSDQNFAVNIYTKVREEKTLFDGLKNCFSELLVCWWRNFWKKKSDNSISLKYWLCVRSSTTNFIVVIQGKRLVSLSVVSSKLLFEDFFDVTEIWIVWNSGEIRKTFYRCSMFDWRFHKLAVLFFFSLTHLNLLKEFKSYKNSHVTRTPITKRQTIERANAQCCALKQIIREDFSSHTRSIIIAENFCVASADFNAHFDCWSCGIQ